jgi:filamentous hemagglutinin family protein
MIKLNQITFKNISISAIINFFALQTINVNAQIIPDTTLNTSLSCNSGICNITGGKTAGNNLFHSFNTFSIPTFGEVYFNNSPQIQNIITRVTGANSSHIDGKISANGTANVFLINPHGLIFDSHASLNIGGSFIATTANNLQFGNAGNFGVNTGNDVSLLTVNPSALLFNQIQTQSITNQGNLQVNPRQNLLFVGNNLTLDQGNLKAPGGKIELASISNGKVELNNDLSLNVAPDVIRGDISLLNNSIIDISGNSGGHIKLQGNNITITNSSGVSSNNLGNQKGGDINIDSSNLNITNKGSISTSTFAEGDGGNLTITSNNIDIVGVRDFGEVASNIFNNKFDSNQLQDGLFTITFGRGKAGDININTKNLIAKNGATIAASTFGKGLGGNLTLKFEEFTNFNNAGMFTGTVSDTGKSGDLTVISNQGKILLENGGAFTTATLNKADAGNLIVQAKELEIKEKSARTFLLFSTEPVYIPSGLSTQSFGDGNAGYLEVNAKKMTMSNDATISSSTVGKIRLIERNAGEVVINTQDLMIGNKLQISAISDRVYFTENSGDLKINADILIVSNGAQIQTFSIGNGKGGNLSINAKTSVEITGTNFSGEFESGLFAGYSGLSIPIISTDIGDAGNLEINTPLLMVSDKGLISVSNGGQGKAGNLNINADTIILNNGTLKAETNANSSIGNIIVNGKLLLMTNNGQITTNGQEAKGGNININSDIIAAFTAINNSNNAITANAQKNFGGRVIINTQGMFGQPFINITASSELGAEFNGTVIINIPGIDPNNSLMQLPAKITDLTKLIQRGCIADKGNRFVSIGRGGLPPNPQEEIRAESDNFSENKNPLVEVSTWQKNAQGQIVLIAESHQSSNNYLSSLQGFCNSR